MTVRRWLPPIFWAALTFTLTSIPNVGRVVPPTFPGADKIVHAGLYGVLALLTLRAVIDPGARLPARIATVFVVMAVLAWIDEWHQQFIPGRSDDTADWIADVSGAALGLLIAATARRRREPST